MNASGVDDDPTNLCGNNRSSSGTNSSTNSRKCNDQSHENAHAVPNATCTAPVDDNPGEAAAAAEAISRSDNEATNTTHTPGSNETTTATAAEEAVTPEPQLPLRAVAPIPAAAATTTTRRGGPFLPSGQEIDCKNTCQSHHPFPSRPRGTARATATAETKEQGEIARNQAFAVNSLEKNDSPAAAAATLAVVAAVSFVKIPPRAFQLDVSDLTMATSTTTHNTVAAATQAQTTISASATAIAPFATAQLVVGPTRPTAASTASNARLVDTSNPSLLVRVPNAERMHLDTPFVPLPPLMDNTLALSIDDDDGGGPEAPAATATAPTANTGHVAATTSSSNTTESAAAPTRRHVLPLPKRRLDLTAPSPNQPKSRMSKWVRGGIVAALLVVGIVVSVVIMTTRSSSSSSSLVNGNAATGIANVTKNDPPNEPDRQFERATLLVDLINNRTLTGRPIRYRRDSDTSEMNNLDENNNSISINNEDENDDNVAVTPWLTAEEWALQWIIESDPLQLWPTTRTHVSLNETTAEHADMDMDDERILQRYALATLWFQQAQDAVWNTTNDWLRHDNECSWFGISCQRQNSSNTAAPNASATTRMNDTGVVVTHINLASNNLLGTLSPDLGLLSRLQHFDVSINGLAGFLPSSLGHSWPMLEHFNVGVNQLYGTLPDSMAHWTDLVLFDVNFNALTITLPTAINTHWTSALEYLYLQFNTFTGPLPTALFDTWSNLRQFNIQNNDFVANLSHTIATTNHSQLTHVSWTSNTGIVGTLPASLGHCWTNLVLFDVYGCALYGTLPESIGHWTNMEHVDFLYNQLSGSLPASLYRWTNVKTAAFFHNNFTGTIPSYLSTWTQLDSILLDQNLFTGPLPSSLGALSDTLTGFSVTSNRLTGTIPESYGAWTNIVQASFEGNNFTGSMPDGLCRIVHASILAMVNATEPYPNPVMIHADCVSEVHCPCCTFCSEDTENMVY